MAYNPNNPNGQATSANSAPVVLASDQMSTANPVGSTSALPVRATPPKLFRTTFAKVIPSGVDPEFFTLLRTGTGMAVSQSGGNLVITSGTTANSETVLRSTQSFTNEMILRWQTILSQRIAQNNFIVELVDVIGDGLAITVNSATSVTVTIPSNPFTSENVGQGMIIGAISGVTNAVPQRGVIASVSGNNVTFTVAGFPVSGSGTCSLFGWNYHQAIYNGTNAGVMTYDAQRKGWNSGVTSAAINTTAAPGHMGILNSGFGVASLSDQLVASVTTIPTAVRASRVINLPDETAQLFIQLRVLNGTAAPASTTTWTVGTVSIEDFSSQPVTLMNTKSQGVNTPQPVQVSNTLTVAIGSGTVTTVASSNGAIPGLVPDVSSAALTTTTTTAAIAPSNGISYSVVIPVTVVTGTNPTLDVQVQESLDTGTNWVTVYDFPRITATGFYNSPPLKLTGNRVRYVQTVGGITPSFTRAISRLQSSQPTPINRQIIDRTVSLTTLNSVTPSLQVAGGCNVRLVINLGAATTPPALQLEGSDDNGTTWYSIGTPLAGVASSTVSTTVATQSPLLLRANVSTAGVAVTSGYVLIGVF